MLRHVIAPVRRYVKASHDVVRHRRLESDAKVLLLYVQGLPESEAARPLGEHAAQLGIKGRAFQKAKQQLVEGGYFHDWRWQGERGRWMTDQVFANVVLSAEEAVRVRDGDGSASPNPQPCPQPSAQIPTVGGPTGRRAGGYLRKKKNEEKNSSHPPTIAPREEPREQDHCPAGPAPDAPPDPSSVPSSAPSSDPSSDPHEPLRRAILAPHLAEAERVLLSLRHADRRLRLGVAEARELAGAAAEWFLRGARSGELREALTTGLPPEGVRYAPGFVRRRLTDKLPEVRSIPEQQQRAREAEPPTPPPQFTTCQGTGNEHVFRPVADETYCGPCRQERAEAAYSAAHAEPI
ncbi:hypothetical protein ACFU99_07535 [Streptomyces sp. NPDC057654]|uniref:hypothetical protein n=1 Tax=Streptomyces sp. NPDC057654 TaxID=3346196 RepID=UPI0036C04673